MNRRFQRQLIRRKFLGVSGNETLLNSGVVSAQELVLGGGHVDKIRLALGPLLVQARQQGPCGDRCRRSGTASCAGEESPASLWDCSWRCACRSHPLPDQHRQSSQWNYGAETGAHRRFPPLTGRRWFHPHRDGLILRQLLGQPGHLRAQDGQRGFGRGQLLCRSRDEQFGVAVLGQSRDMAHAVHIQFRRFPFVEMVAFPLAPLAVALCESRLADQTNALAMPKCYDEINPLLVAISAFRAGKQLVYTWKDFVSEGNEIVLQRHHIFHVEIVLAGAQLQLFSNRFHRGIFPQIYPVVKSVLGNLHCIGLVGLDLADGTSAALLDEQWVYHGHADTVLMQRP